MAGSEDPIRALTFGTVAEAYDRYRLGYPAEVVELVLGHAVHPVRTALEIGAGTGKATQEFLAAGVAVTALEPDPAMLARLTANLGQQAGPALAPLLGTLEDADLPDRVDLVYAAAALHWTDPATRWSRIAGLLPTGGVVASFGGPREFADERLREEVRRVSEPIVDDDIPSPDGTPADAPMQWPGTELSTSALFTDVEQHVVERRIEVGADEVVGHLSTVSAYLVLSPADRTEVLSRIRAVLPERVELVADVILHLARRSG